MYIASISRGDQSRKPERQASFTADINDPVTCAIFAWTREANDDSGQVNAQTETHERLLLSTSAAPLSPPTWMESMKKAIPCMGSAHSAP